MIYPYSSLYPFMRKLRRLARGPHVLTQVLQALRRRLEAGDADAYASMSPAHQALGVQRRGLLVQRRRQRPEPRTCACYGFFVGCPEACPSSRLRRWSAAAMTRKRRSLPFAMAHPSVFERDTCFPNANIGGASSFKGSVADSMSFWFTSLGLWIDVNLVSS